jgi:ATP-dependent protease ClpP protease subunit
MNKVFELLTEGIDVFENNIYFSGPIESDFLSLIRPRFLYLKKTRPTEKEINLYLDSVGGDLSVILATKSFFKRLEKNHQVKVNIIVEGRCYSAALLLLLVATGKRKAIPSTLFMFHETTSKLNEEAQGVMKKEIEKIINNFRVFEKKVSIFIEKKDSLKENFFFSAKEAKQFKIIDEILD